jgi:cobaltochelatase CobT
MSRQKPQIFLSYSAFDEEHDRGRLSALCSRLKEEVRLQTGEEVSIWRDREEIKGGDNWRETIEQQLRDSDILIAFITPSYLNSRFCRQEITQFLDKEKDQKRKGLIVPIIYLGSEEHLTDNDLGREIVSRRGFDWRALRFEPFTSSRLKREIEKTATAIGKALETVTATG